MALVSARYKQLYLANLQQEVNNINRTTNAVAMKLSGNTVPEEPQDTRSVEQKFADVERLKVELRSKLMTITDGKQAGLIMNKLQDPGDIVFALQVFPTIAEIAKQKFNLGIPEPSFMNIFERLQIQQVNNSGVAGQLEEFFPRSTFNPQAQEAQNEEDEEAEEEAKDAHPFLPSGPRRAPMRRQPVVPTSESELEGIPRSPRPSRPRKSHPKETASSDMGLKNPITPEEKRLERNRKARERYHNKKEKERNVPAQVTQEKEGKDPDLDYFSSIGFGLSGFKMKGKGLGVTKKQPPKIEGKVEKPPSYVPFGRFVINKHKLNEGTLMVRTPRGGAISKLPTERISDGLSKIVQTISQGNIPSFDDMSQLSESEKRHIHNIVSHSHIERVSVPKPDLSKDEQDLHRFQVLKGEIGAGQSSQAVIKELKLLIIRLLSAGKLPKRQASEALVEMASIGL